MISEVKNMDCIEYMKQFPDNYFELAIVDPPYGIGLGFSDKHEQKRGGGKKGGHEQKDWNKKTPDSDYFDELLRVSQKHIIWGSNYYGENFKKFGQGIIIHNKKVTPFIHSTYSHADIASTNCQNRITMFDFQWSGNVQNGKMNTKNETNFDLGIEQRLHPTQKPVALYRWLLQNYAKPNYKILDTHLGSGSSRIAADMEGFDFYACELDKDYFDASCKRFDEYKLQTKLF
jgi:site-specific DNA-methyltransferase (adenine-specific)